MRQPHTTAVRGLIRSELPGHYFEACPERSLAAIFISVLLVSTNAALLSFPEATAACIALSFLCGLFYSCLFFVGHEAGHGSIVSSRLGQDLIMIPAFLVFMLSPTLWRVWHNSIHHAHANSPNGDPDNFGTVRGYSDSVWFRMVARLTPGSGRWQSTLYLPTWFTAHTQIVLWLQSNKCPGFAALDRRRAIVETLAMMLFWAIFGVVIGFTSSILVIFLPMMIANAIIMSYIITNHFLRPMTEDGDPLETSMSVTTSRWLDLMHSNFSHHVEHHLFPAMNPRYAPHVRARLQMHCPGRYLAPPHWQALLLVFRTPRYHSDDGALLDPDTGRQLSCRDLAALLSSKRLGLTVASGAER